MSVWSKYKSIFIVIVLIFFVSIGYNLIGKVRADIGFKYLASGPAISPTTFKYNVHGAKKVIFNVYVQFENDYYNYAYQVDQNDQLRGDLALPIAAENVEVIITAISEKGKKSNTLGLSTQWYRLLPFILYHNVIPYSFNIKE
ncbi:hypothetical protein A3A93_03090 [Candidatus Roizmanbacteria bacterium RIFCSPLOWO2_01_FULL_38_12]|uniref:Uncharacterized protein n=1 Tax=Candidatus Roizmanbacteria bacterium RIFCSPLOWO2_01_FULL_38_12 TaxID=1802061 RepID=A0A1F7ISJ8_9BACT|nr:MAG: hypothetical protein A2861_03755 [Candidatus Roizmanbacteria bacterium RIFCSPHIGHO2_01_FULL_38_15]OGK35520.1 MAG: hypothetical protein A3F59_05740 [Candidatus Roizmanbacteria bacterium RIFCSPHIGHO2_12_FULL_38_13]OGK46337.1 MAG: hypothetical protein A3A93_03090 [Candidatus Roizmanbacteria bacterium RIFCSPLOWO2_01_FULL_38_12]